MLNVELAQPSSEWDKRVDAAGPEGDFLQTSHWAAIDGAANARISFVLISGPIGALVSHAADGGELRCLHGPVFSELRELEALPPLVSAVEALARDARCGSVTFVGRPPRSAISTDELAAILTACGFHVTPWYTALVDLRRAEGAILSETDRSVRKAIRRCEREGVSVRRCTSKASFERDFLAPFADATPGYDPQRDRTAFELDAGRNYAYCVAVASDGVVLATLGTYRFAGVATEIMSARTAAGRERGLPAQDLLHWELMRFHRSLGDEWFDLAGYAADAATPKEAGIRRFKEKWGGVSVSMPNFVKPLHGRVRAAARRLRQRVA